MSTRTMKPHFLPFSRVAWRGDSPEAAGTYICASPNWGYPMGYMGRIDGEEVTDHAILRAAYYAIVREVNS